MAVVHRGVRVTLAHNTFHRMARIDLLEALHAKCREVGVALRFGARVDDPGALGDCDLVVAADGANSAIRRRLASHFRPQLDERPNWLAWYGTTKPFDALSLIFRQNDDGLVIAHAYRYAPALSTFLVECDPATFERAGLAAMSDADSLAYCERTFADDLDGHRLLSNASKWFRYTMVRNERWFHDNVVLIGDALRTGHPSVGSGTRLAMQDAIALFDAYRAHATDDGRCDVPAMLATFVPHARAGLGEPAAGRVEEHRVVRGSRAEARARPGLVRVRLRDAQRSRRPCRGRASRSRARRARTSGCIPRRSRRERSTTPRWPDDVARRYREAGLWEGIDVAAMVARTAARLPDKVALVAGERRVTYRALVDTVDAVAAGLLDRGLRDGDRVVVQLPNVAEFVFVYLALNRIGAIPVMALRAHRHAEVRHFLRASGAVGYVDRRRRRRVRLPRDGVAR